MKYYIPFLILIVTFGLVVYPAYSQITISGTCLNETLFAIWQLNTILECLDTRIIDVNNSIGASTDDTLCTNVGSGSQVYKDGECNFRTVLGSPDISVTQQADTITVDYNGSSGSESTVCSNVGTGNPLHKVGTNCNAFSLIAGDRFTITNTTDDYTLSSNLQTSTLLNSTIHTDTITQTVSRGSVIAGDLNSKWNEVTIGTASKNLRSNGTDVSWSWDTIVSTSSEITLVANDNMAVINIGVGGNAVVNLPDASLVHGKTYCIKHISNASPYRTVTINPTFGDIIDGYTQNLTLRNEHETYCFIANANDLWHITSHYKGMITQVVGLVYLSLTKTNLPVTYTDIYVTAFDQENQMFIDCGNVTMGRITYQWDFVGAGNDQLRWVNVADNTQVFYETPTFTVDQDATTSPYFVKPTWCTGTVTLEWQGKSSNGTNDPVAKGYKIMVR